MATCHARLEVASKYHITVPQPQLKLPLALVFRQMLKINLMKLRLLGRFLSKDTDLDRK